LIVTFHYQVPRKILNRIGRLIQIEIASNPEPIPLDYSGYIYPKEMIESLMYMKENFNIIMLGDSLTCHNNWGELLEREDVANFGIGGDTTDAIIRRINDIDLVSPNEIFLMVGINDIFGNRPIEEIVRNYQIIIKLLKQRNLEINIQSVLYISDLAIETWGHDPARINNDVNKLNLRLEQIAMEEKLQWIDLNIVFENDNNLNNKYTSGDGVHLNRDGYIIWSNELKKHLK
jgi:lysophospholipase L1-like esterase